MAEGFAGVDPVSDDANHLVHDEDDYEGSTDSGQNFPIKILHNLDLLFLYCNWYLESIKIG